jgi:hypothetical protein
MIPPWEFCPDCDPFGPKDPSNVTEWDQYCIDFMFWYRELKTEEAEAYQRDNPAPAKWDFFYETMESRRRRVTQ